MRPYFSICVQISNLSPSWMNCSLNIQGLHRRGLSYTKTVIPTSPFSMYLKLIFKITTVLSPSWSSVGDLASLPIGHNHSDRGNWEKPALSSLLCRFQVMISFMSGTVKNRKIYTAWKHLFKISQSFSELKNDWKNLSSARHPSQAWF